MWQILVLDQDRQYARALAADLERRLAPCRAVAQDDAQTADLAAFDAVLAGEGFFSWHPAVDIPVLRLGSFSGDRDVHPDPARDGADTLPRLGDTARIAAALQARTGAPRPAPEGNEGASAADPPLLAGVIGDVCLRSRRLYLGRLFGAALSRGGRCVYLPFLPASRAAYVPMSARREASVTRLLLLAASGDPCDDAIGVSLHPSRGGILCLRAASSHADLARCPPAHLRVVTEAVVRWLATCPAGTVAVADLAELAEDAAAAILSLCTSCHDLVETDTSGRAVVPDRFGDLLARLPTRCKVRREGICPPCARPQEADPSLTRGAEDLAWVPPWQDDGPDDEKEAI